MLEKGHYIYRTMIRIHHSELYNNTSFLILQICWLNCYVLEHWNTYFEVLKTNSVAEVCSWEIYDVEEISFKID